MLDEPLKEVQLPVCPRCGNVSKLADGVRVQFRGTKCQGPWGNRHRTCSMELRLFREVPVDGDRS